MTNHTITTDELERLAAQITQGQWIAEEGANSHCFDISIYSESGGSVAFSDEVNGQAIAILPALLRELIARRKADEWQRAALESALDALVDAKKDWWREAAPQWNMSDFLNWATVQKMTAAISAIRATAGDRHDDLMTAGLNGEDARFVAIQLAQNGLSLTPAPQPAGEAVPVAWAVDDEGTYVDVDLHHDVAEQWRNDDFTVVPLYAHPPQPGVSVAREKVAFALWCEEAGNTTLRRHRTRKAWDDQSEDTRERFLRFADAALRALKGGE